MNIGQRVMIICGEHAHFHGDIIEIKSAGDIQYEYYVLHSDNTSKWYQAFEFMAVEPSIDNLMPGDVVEDVDGYESKVLAVLNDVFLISYWKNFYSVGEFYTKSQAKDNGWTVKPSTKAPETTEINNEKEVIIDMPEITMKEIVDNCGNKTSKGTPLLCSIEWYRDEDFYTKEKTRPGKIIFTKEIMPESRNKSWWQQEELLKDNNSSRLNAAEVLYILWKYEKDTDAKLLSNSYYWTSSRESSGGLVRMGDFDSGGASLYRGWAPDGTFSVLGVCLSCKFSTEEEKAHFNVPFHRVEDILKVEIISDLVELNGKKYKKEDVEKALSGLEEVR